MKKLSLILEDGTILTGNSFGCYSETEGEVVFSTSMCGYPDSFTDPSFRGQILVMTYPLIGNYGIPNNSKDKYGIKNFFESNTIHIKGLIVSENSNNFHHWNAKKSLGNWLKINRIPAVEGIDTRTLTQKLRKKGTMLGKIIKTARPAYYDKIEDPNKKNLVKEVSCKTPKKYISNKKSKTVLLYDCGVKLNILRCFLKRGINIIRVPWNFNLKKNRFKFDGVFVSNGPGNPKTAKDTIDNIKYALTLKKPFFGICLGNQLLALAIGADTYKLKYGHRGINQPCTDLKTGRCYITSQNHGFAVNAKTLPNSWTVWFKNENDNTVEGIRHKIRPIFSTQFHPEATPGPEDTEFLFDYFIKYL